MRTMVCGRWNKHSSLYPQTKNLWKIRNACDAGSATKKELETAEDAVTEFLLAELETWGVDLVGDGGIRWDSIFDVARKIGGCSGFTELTRIPDTNHFHRQPAISLPLAHQEPILVNDLLFAKTHIKKPIVVSLPGPYTLARQTQNTSSLGLSETSMAYADILNREVKALLSRGADLVRIEEPLILANPEDYPLFQKLADKITEGNDQTKLMLASWFGNITSLQKYFTLPFEYFFLDFIEGKKNFDALKNFPLGKKLVAGIFDARETRQESDEELSRSLAAIERYVPREYIIISHNTDLHFLPWENAKEKVLRLVSFAKEYNGQDATSSLPPLAAEPKQQKKFPQRTPSLHPHSALPSIPFLTSAVGSYPQTPEIRHARIKLRNGELDEPSYRELVERHTMDWLAFQQNIKLDIPVGGEFLREDMAVYFGVRIGGKTLDFVPSYENRRYRPVEYRTAIHAISSFTAGDFNFLQNACHAPLKETLTGPATLADWGLIGDDNYYHNRRQFRMDFAATLRKEIASLIAAGAKIIQIDEPALTTKMTNFFMDCDAIYETVRDFDDHAYFILHICYSDLTALDTAFPTILELPFHQIHMEMANRNYRLLPLIEKYGFAGKDIGLGVIDVHTDKLERTEDIVDGVRRILAIRDSKTDVPVFSPQKIWLTPDCGLKERSEEIAKEKLRIMVQAAEACRQEFVSEKISHL